MLQVAGCFPFSASDQPLSSWPSSDGGNSGGGTFDNSETSSSQALSAWPSVSSLTPNAGYSEQLYGYSLSEYEGPIVKNSNPSDASGWRAFASVAGRNFLAKRCAVSILDWGGTAMRLGLWDAGGYLLSMTPRFVGANDLVVVASLSSAVQFMGSMPYYIGYWSDDNTANLKLRCVSGRSVSPRSPLMQRNDLNENPTNLGGGNDMFTQFRPWLMVME